MQGEVPNIYYDSPGEEFNWQYKFCYYHCHICNAKTTLTYFKNGIPVLTHCHSCGASEHYKEVREVIG